MHTLAAKWIYKSLQIYGNKQNENNQTHRGTAKHQTHKNNMKVDSKKWGAQPKDDIFSDFF